MALIEDKYKDLMGAVHHDDLDVFKTQLEHLHPKHCLYAKSLDNVVHIIAQLGREPFLNAVIDKFKANELLELLEIRNAEDKVPLHEAAQFSHVNIVKILLEHGVAVDPIKRADWTPLMLACTKVGEPALDVIKVLVDKGANLFLVNKVGNSYASLTMALLKRFF